MAKILLADDEEALRLLMGRQLRRAGHEVTTAEDGMQAAEFLQQENFEVIISDMKMPRLDGMGLLARARELAPQADFIILTGHGNMENAVECFKTGNVFDYLLKPLEDIREIDAVVDRALERQHLRRENTRLVTDLEAHIQELEAARRQLAELAERDGLTGLYNHRTIHAKLQEALDQDSAAPVTLLLLDMDGFKRLNDAYGHPIGDQALRHIASALQASCGENATAGRYGGDEFMVVLPGVSIEAGQTIIARIQQRIMEPPFRNPEGVPLPLRLCAGLADTQSTGRSAISLVTAADTALYQGKRSGGNKVTLHMTEERPFDAETDSEGADQRTSFDVLDGLVTAIDNKDHYTKAHSEDMTHYALQLAHAMGYSDQTCNIVRVAGLLHDVGKIGVPDAILQKPGKLTAEEYEVMKNHVTLSTLIIHGLPHLSEILDAVSNHHERWDGRGYPQGLAGEQIPLLGRVMAIADAFSAMTLSRPYRMGMPIEAALAEIERGAGSQFDPKLAQLFVNTMRAQILQTERKAA